MALGTRAAVPWGWSARKRPEVTVALARVETCWVWKPGRSVQTRECAGRRGRCPSPGTGLCRMGLGWGFEVGRGERLAWAQMWQGAASRVRPELPGERAGMEGEGRRPWGPGCVQAPACGCHCDTGEEEPVVALACTHPAWLG